MNLSICSDLALQDLLTRAENKGFTITELRDRYVAHPSCATGDKNDARQLIHRHIAKLREKNVVGRERLDGSSKWIYFVIQEDVSVEAIDNAIDLGLLQRELMKHRTEMDICLGEAEAFDELIKKYPQISDEISSDLESTKRRASAMLGKYRALETVIQRLSI